MGRGGGKKTKRSKERRRKRRRRRKAKKNRRSPGDEKAREEERGRKGVFRRYVSPPLSQVPAPALRARSPATAPRGRSWASGAIARAAPRAAAPRLAALPTAQPGAPAGRLPVPSPSASRPPRGCDTPSGPAARSSRPWARGASPGSACSSCWSTRAPPSMAKLRKVREARRGAAGRRGGGAAGRRGPSQGRCLEVRGCQDPALCPGTPRPGPDFGALRAGRSAWRSLGAAGRREHALLPASLPPLASSAEVRESSPRHCQGLETEGRKFPAMPHTLRTLIPSPHAVRPKFLSCCLIKSKDVKGKQALSP